jgi:hypothetical protein
MGRFIARNWQAALLVLLIVAILLFSPDEMVQFIYTEF